MQNPYSVLNMPSEPYGGMVYPEIYYKVQPFVMSSCDAMLLGYGGNMMPTWNQVETMSEEIYADVCSMHPELLEYAGTGAGALSVEASQFGGGRFRRRGMFRDFVDILLLNEMFRRGGFFF